MHRALRSQSCLDGVYLQINHHFFSHVPYITHSVIDNTGRLPHTDVWKYEVPKLQVRFVSLISSGNGCLLITFKSVSLRSFLNTTAAFSCVISWFLSMLAMLSNFVIVNNLHQRYSFCWGCLANRKLELSGWSSPVPQFSCHGWVFSSLLIMWSYFFSSLADTFLCIAVARFSPEGHIDEMLSHFCYWRKVCIWHSLPVLNKAYSSYLSQFILNYSFLKNLLENR